MATRLNPGDTYLTFEVLDRLGEGGFGTVYKVKDPRYAEPLALKLSHDPIVAGDAAQRPCGRSRCCGVPWRTRTW